MKALVLIIGLKAKIFLYQDNKNDTKIIVPILFTILNISHWKTFIDYTYNKKSFFQIKKPYQLQEN